MSFTLTGIWAVLSAAAPFLKGKNDYPTLKNEQGILPLHYMQHCRASSNDLTSVWKDGHTICDDETGVPVARWSYSGQKLEPVTGFTIQGLPVYEDVPPSHPVWTTVRNVPSHLGTPGSEGTTAGRYGDVLLYKPGIRYRRGEKLVEFLGMYGPLAGGMPAPEEETAAPGRGLPLGGLLILGGAAALVAGATVPGAVAVAAGLAISRTPAQGVRGYYPGEGPQGWQRTPGMSDEEAEASWAAWLAQNPQQGRG